MRSVAKWSAIMLAASAAGALAVQATPRKPVRTIDDLPRHSYPYRGPVDALIEQPAVLGPLATRAKSDTEATLAGYAIEDRATLRQLHGTLLSIAMYQRDYPAVLREVATIRDLADKPLDKATAGAMQLAYAQAAAGAQPGTPAFPAAFQQAYAAGLKPLPWALYGDMAQRYAGQDALLSRAMAIGGTASLFQPQADKGGAFDDRAISGIVRAAVNARDVVPLRQQMIAADRGYLAANAVAKADIWPGRDLVFPAAAKLTPVVVAIWDSGVDASVFPQQLWTNRGEVANGRDDDGNGYVDDIHGIASDDHGQRTTALLTPVPPDVTEPIARLTVLAKGVRDQLSNEATPAAAALLAFIDHASVAQMGKFWDDMDFYGEYFHGTHVAGIVARGNTAIRMMIVKHSFDWRPLPRRPTEATATAYARQYVDQVAYMRAAGVRVANMSWTVDLKGEYEDQLAANGVPEVERTAEARRLFAIDAAGLKRAIQSAPDILFVCASGNSNNSAAFEASVPASFELPNVMTVAAVGQDGVPTSFTTTGPTIDIAADGFDVESYVPGGTRMKSSGTSMASPGVVNAAAKLLALDPKLTTAQLRALLIDTATPGDGGFRLLNAKAAAAKLATAGMVASR